MRRTFTGAGLVLALTALGLVLAGGGAAKPEQEVFKAAWIYVGPHNDGGWSQAHDAGRLKVQKALGAKIKTTYKENVPEGPQVAQVIESLIRDGNKMIFATSFGFQTAMVAAASSQNRSLKVMTSAWRSIAAAMSRSPSAAPPASWARPSRKSFTPVELALTVSSIRRLWCQKR